VPLHITLSFKLSFEKKGEREKVIGKKDNEIFDPKKSPVGFAWASR
jgi:hypothetical protein